MRPQVAPTWFPHGTRTAPTRHPHGTQVILLNMWILFKWVVFFIGHVISWRSITHVYIFCLWNPYIYNSYEFWYSPFNTSLSHPCIYATITMGSKLIMGPNTRACSCLNIAYAVHDIHDLQWLFTDPATADCIMSTRHMPTTDQGFISSRRIQETIHTHWPISCFSINEHV